MKRGRRRKCLCCGGLFRPDPRSYIQERSMQPGRRSQAVGRKMNEASVNDFLGKGGRNPGGQGMVAIKCISRGKEARRTK